MTRAAQRAPAALIIDFDDTLVRMTDRRWTLFEQELGAHGADVQAIARMNLRRGQGSYDALVSIALPEADVECFTIDYATKLSVETIELCPGVESILDWAASAGVPVSILSSSSRVLVQRDLELAQLDHHIDAIFGYEDVPAVKPSPLAVASVLRSPTMSGCSADDVLMIGDSLSDSMAARGQCHFAAVLSSATSKQAFVSSGVATADVFDSLDDLTAALRFGTQRSETSAPAVDAGTDSRMG